MSFHFPVITVLFYAFAALLIISALMVVFSRHPVQSALYLVLAFFASSALWIIAQAEFLGLILILVYVGAVMTLFLFVVMTVPTYIIPMKPQTWGYIALAIFLMCFFVALMTKAMIPANHIAFSFNDSTTSDLGTAEAIGRSLYTQYIFPFEMAGLILLIAIIAAITLSWKMNRGQKIVNNEAEQIAVNPKSRLKIIKMPSEKRDD